MLQKLSLSCGVELQCAEGEGEQPASHQVLPLIFPIYTNKLQIRNQCRPFPARALPDQSHNNYFLPVQTSFKALRNIHLGGT